MKTSIDTLVRAWVIDNRSNIEENYETIEDYLLESIENAENWEYDFFADEEIESNSISELKEQAKEFISRYRCTPSDLLDEKRGGARENAGRKKVGGRQHLWTIPSDIEEIAKAKGTAYLWECVRFKEKFDKMK